ncbi:unnamed protein product [Blepharisma stoltei]|uniref:Uncharacterized protein n=1 Tax=Blepharisma stoltei TaxID=1481888 RepID=A0AAU9JJD9_9CILI|nr:unnamed protein product [Blepharisma stoltei]
MAKHLLSNIEYLFKYKQPTQQRSQIPSLSLNCSNPKSSNQKLSESKLLRKPTLNPLPPELRILCKNCEDLIPIDLIESHSRTCLCISESLLILESFTSLDQINFRLKKLEKCLMEMTEKIILKPGDKSYVSILLRLCQKISELNYGEDRKNEETLRSLSSLLITFRGSLTLKIYADRLKSLAHDQKLALKEAKNANLEELRNKALDFQKALNNAVSLGLKSQELNKKIDEITSELESLTSENTVISSTTTQEMEDSLMQIENFENININSQQRFFYSLCIAEKMKSPSKSKLHNISIQKLYNKAIALKIRIENWQKWIEESFKSPDFFIEKVPRPKARKSTRKHHYFETIIEE